MVSSSGMNNARLDGLLREAVPGIQGADGFWSAQLDEDLTLYVETDERCDRLRIVIPVAEARRSDNDLLFVLLVANYELAQDAKYAVRDGVVVCTFLHRLSWLTALELRNALRHVITLARNTGSTFSSVDHVVQDEYKA